MRYRVALFVVIVAAGSSLGAEVSCQCGGGKIDRTKIESSIRELARLGAQPTAVRCPDSCGEAGDVFECVDMPAAPSPWW
jgi:hypothetical protein